MMESCLCIFPLVSFLHLDIYETSFIEKHFLTIGQHGVGGTTCVVTVWKNVPRSGPQYLRDLCRGMKKCYGLVLADKHEDLDKLSVDIHEPPLDFKYSNAVNWILLKQVNVQQSHYSSIIILVNFLSFTRIMGQLWPHLIVLSVVCLRVKKYFPCLSVTSET